MEEIENLCRTTSGRGGDDRDIDNFLEPVGAGAEGDLQEGGNLAVALLNFLKQITVSSEIRLVDPVPGEVADGDNRNPGGVGNVAGEEGDVGENELDFVLLEK